MCHIRKHALETHVGNTHLLPDATMSHLNPCQRHALASAIFPLFDLIRPRESHPQVALTPISDFKSEPSISGAAATVNMTVIANANNPVPVPPHPKQGGERIMEAYLWEMTEAECIWRFRFVSQLCIGTLLH